MLENSNPVNGGTADSERTAFDQLNEAFAVRVGLVGESPALRTLFERVRKLADSHVAVLIVGETGTGKESVARALHHNSARARGPFIAEGCATLSASLFAQRLFGHARGAFTGAVATASGLLDRADGGTLFLDEISDLALDAQGVLLRALSCGEYRALGSSETRRSDFRVIASTHCDIPALVRMGQFRHDLYWRLRGAILRVPPLRERRSDIEDLARQVHRELHLRTRRPLPPLSHDAIEALKAHSWPGNVLELRQELMQAWATADGESLGPSAFQFECLENVGPRSASAARGRAHNSKTCSATPKHDRSATRCDSRAATRPKRLDDSASPAARSIAGWRSSTLSSRRDMPRRRMVTSPCRRASQPALTRSAEAATSTHGHPVVNRVVLRRIDSPSPRSAPT
ncbi:MAG: sigma-54-dependent Fis family transcriptional regulator [Planctomycetes bacterium]|nr:sigma-54-dependent Fis family transcriptional regulator [Planctomycetota bacterium]